jgi:TorA maturation chaperone TorD
MTMMREKAELLGFLAQAFEQPTAQLAEELSSGAFAFQLRVLLEAARTDALGEEQWRQLGFYAECRPKYTLQELRTEHTRLFIGWPEALTPYSEGIFRQKKLGETPQLINNATTFEVQELMRSCGILPASGNREPIDNVYTELEFACFLLMPEVEELPNGRKPEEMRLRFYHAHLAGWVPEVCKDVSLASTAAD